MFEWSWYKLNGVAPGYAARVRCYAGCGWWMVGIFVSEQGELGRLLAWKWQLPSAQAARDWANDWLQVRLT